MCDIDQRLAADSVVNDRASAIRDDHSRIALTGIHRQTGTWPRVYRPGFVSNNPMRFTAPIHVRSPFLHAIIDGDRIRKITFQLDADITTCATPCVAAIPATRKHGDYGYKQCESADGDDSWSEWASMSDCSHQSSLPCGSAEDLRIQTS